MPVGMSLDQLLYRIRRSDADDGLIFDSVTLDDILEEAEAIFELDALVATQSSLGRKVRSLERVMSAGGGELEVVASQVSSPFKRQGVVNVAAIFELSDGQTVTVMFHNPDAGTAKSLKPTDELISWKWMLNKKDITIVVAPERGSDLPIRQVARRIMKLAEKNSKTFARMNQKRAERLAYIESLKGEIGELETELDGLTRQIEIARIEAEDKALNTPKPLTKQEGLDLLDELRPWLSRQQYRAMADVIRKGEEGAAYIDRAQALASIIDGMAKSYEQDGKGMEATAYLHYFRGGGDWYITEKDAAGDGTEQAFGWSDPGLGHGELGYIGVDELTGAGVELDLYFEPKPLSQAVTSQGEEGGRDPNIGREWDSVWGRQRIVERKESPTGALYLVETVDGGKVGTQRQYSVDNMEDAIRRQEYETTDAYQDEQRQAEEDRLKREERHQRQAYERAKQDAEVQAFADERRMSTLGAAKARDALMKQVSYNGVAVTRKALIEQKVEGGARVVGEGSERRLESNDDTFLGQAAITKTGMDYAEYLISQDAAGDEAQKVKVSGNELGEFPDAADAPSALPQNPQTADDFARIIAAGDEAKERYRDQLDSFFQGRVIEVRNALRELGWDGEPYGDLSKGGATLVVNTEQVGAGGNAVGVSYTLSGVPGFFMSDSLEHTPKELAELIDLGVVSRAGEPPAEPTGKDTPTGVNADGEPEATPARADEPLSLEGIARQLEALGWETAQQEELRWTAVLPGVAEVEIARSPEGETIDFDGEPLDSDKTSLQAAYLIDEAYRYGDEEENRERLGIDDEGDEDAKTDAFIKAALIVKDSVERHGGRLHFGDFNSSLSGGLFDSAASVPYGVCAQIAHGRQGIGRVAIDEAGRTLIYVGLSGSDAVTLDGEPAQASSAHPDIVAMVKALMDNILTPHDQVMSEVDEIIAEAGQRHGSAEAPTEDDIEQARQATDTDPSEAEKESGDYAKGEVEIHGMTIAIENPKGSERSGTTQEGEAWSVSIAHDYGYIKGTKGADGDEVDVFIGPDLESERVFVINQVGKDGELDEHKVMLGFATKEAAEQGYLSSYRAGWDGLGSTQEMSVDELKAWLPSAAEGKPAAAEEPAEEAPAADPLEQARAVTQRDEFASLTRDFTRSLATIKGIDAGTMPGMERSLFVNSITGKIKTRAKRDPLMAGVLLAWLAEQQKDWDKPAVTARNAVWKAADDWESYRPLFNRDAAPSGGQEAGEGEGGATPEPAAPESEEEAMRRNDRQFLQSVIDGTVPDMLSPDLADRILAVMERQSGDAEMEDLIERAGAAYERAMLSATEDL